MNSLPLVCVCIPCYNAENTIEDTLRSLLAQTYENIEIHIFDNASSDNSLHVVSKLDNPRLIVHRENSTSDAETNFTRCLNLGRGKYTAIYHADDLYAPDIIENEVMFLEDNKEVGGVLTFANIIDENSQRTKTVYAPLSLKLKRLESASFDLITLYKAVLRENNFLFCPSAMIRTIICTSELKEWRGGLFGPGADLDTWFRIAKLGKLGLINRPLLQYRVCPAHFSYTHNKYNTNRADLFTILDYWMKKSEVADSLNKSDLDWYATWLMWDDITRARNALKKGEVKFAHNLLRTVSAKRLLKDSCGSLRGLKFFMLFILVCVKAKYIKAV